MTDQTDAPWPQPTFSFAVEIAGETLVFQEVTGLTAETQPIEYRAGNSPIFSTVKMPGIAKTGTVTLRKGIFAKDSRLFAWHAQIRQNAVARADVTIRLLDEHGTPTMTWTLVNCWPSKLTGSSVPVSGDAVAVESVELVHEGIRVVQGG